MNNLKKGIATAASAILAYDLYYKFKYNRNVVDVKPYPIAISGDSYSQELDWVEEHEVILKMNQVVRPYLQNLAHKGVLYREDIAIHYIYYHQEELSDTLIVFTHGFNEFKEKFFELAYYLIQAGYDVLLYDVRGHGQSRKVHESHIHITDFDLYVDDLHGLLHEDMALIDKYDSVFLMTHSMGSAISLRYAHDYPEKIKGVILSSPMFEIHTGWIPQSFISIASKVTSFMNGKNLPIPGQKYQSPIGIPREMPEDFPQRPVLTYCWDRSLYTELLYRELMIYTTTGGTMGWLNECIKQVELMYQDSFLSSISMPVLMFIAKDDPLVTNRGQLYASKKIPKAFIYQAGLAGHNLLEEHDTILYPLIDKVLAFLDHYSS